MALDYLAFSRIISLMKDDLEGGKITKISQISNEEFLFIVRNNNYNYNLLISTHPNMSYINIANNKPASNHINTNFLMLLRKHLENGRIIDFSQQNSDRIVLISIINRDDYFNDTVHKLYVELIGRASNIILTNNDNLIIDSLKKIPLEYSNLRTIQPNIHYTLPSKPENESLPYDLINQINYESSNEEIIKERINNSNKIYITIKENKKDFHFIPLTYLEGETKEYNYHEGLDEFYSSTLESERHRQFTSNMDKLARNEIKRNENKKVKLTKELQLSKEAIVYKYYADLLLTYMQGVKISSDKVEIFDEMEEKTVIIPYDLRYDLYHNANLYYKKYQKSKVALVKLQEQIDLCDDNIEYFNSIRFQLSQADYMIAMETKEELTEIGFFKKFINTKANKSNKKNKPKVYRPMTIVYNGVNIYVGQNNLQNEYLTFKVANKAHMFFHVKDGPGSHVVVASDRVDEDLKRFAANVAAYYSSYQSSSTVPVNYTLVKNVKKIPSGKPGKVIINNYKTIYVDPDFSKIKDKIK